MRNLSKKLVASAVAFTLLASAGSAYAMGGPRQGGERQGQQLGYIFSQMELNEQQQEDVLATLEALREQHKDQMWEQMKEMRERDERPSQDEKQALRDAFRAQQSQAMTDQLNTVLSPEQTEELVEYLDAHRAMFEGRKGGHQGKMWGNR